MEHAESKQAVPRKPVSKKVLAVDLGASSGRVMLASFDGSKLELREIHRFDNVPIEENGGIYWDADGLLSAIHTGIRLAAAEGEPILSIGVDTWGVDYGWIGRDGELLRRPHHYRDARMAKHAAELERRLPRGEQFKLTGNQPDTINTVYQIFADLAEDPQLRQSAARILMMPDLFHYKLSGVMAAEHTIFSTSGLMTAGGDEPAAEVLERLGIPAALFAPSVPAGTVLGTLRPELQADLQCGALQIIAGASHDTASAAAAIPYAALEWGSADLPTGSTAAFISCGTWSIAGLETPRPVLSEAAFASGFTNEACYGGGNRLLKNITGLWLLQECRRHWNATGAAYSHAELATLAEEAGAAVARIDPADPRFAAPGDMPERIRQYCRSSGQAVPGSPGELVRVVLESLADAYAAAIDELEVVSGRPITAIHLVGGGSRNRLLCRLTAERTARTVIAGPTEASAAGSALIQFATLGELDFAQRSAIIERSFTLERFAPL